MFLIFVAEAKLDLCYELVLVMLENVLKQLLRINCSEEVFWCGRSYSCIRV